MESPHSVQDAIYLPRKPFIDTRDSSSFESKQRREPSDLLLHP